MITARNIGLALLLSALLGGLALAAEPPTNATNNPELEIPGPEGKDSERILGSETAALTFIRHGRQGLHRKNGLKLSGDIYIDTGYERSGRGLESEPDMVFWLQNGRMLLRVTPTYTNGRFFVRAGGAFLAHVDEIAGNESIDTDDAWLKLGIWDVFDIQLGRFEGWEVYHKGQGLERDTLEDLGAFGGPDIYEVNYAYYRQNGFGQVAAHIYPTDTLRFEVASVFGNELGYNAIGVRGAGILDFGAIKLKVAGEWRKRAPMEEGQEGWEEQRGFGGSLQVFLDDPKYAVPLQFGVNGAFGLVDRIDPFGNVDERASVDTLSVGGFLNMGLGKTVLGLGYNHTIQGDRQRNDQTNKDGHFVHYQGFASVKRPIVFSKLTAKLVFAFARADLQPAFDNARINDMYSVRLRMLYRF
jgi:hypothetical protein